MSAIASFSVSLPANYRPQDALRRIGRDPETRDEQTGESQFTKALLLGAAGERFPVRLRISLTSQMAQASVESTRPVSEAVVSEALTVTHRLLGLTLDPDPFEERAQAEESVRRLVAGREGLRIALTASVFEGVIWAILGQQVNVTFASTLRRRLIDLCGHDAGDGFLAHPAPEDVARLDYADLTPLQISQRKAEYVIDTARLATEGLLPLEDLAALPYPEAENRLLAVRGFGPWSANYLLMRSCGFPDCVPLGDTGIRDPVRRFFGLDHAPTVSEVAEHMAIFAPHRSLATFHLWHFPVSPV
ncbi:MAG: DNA-3-methyladenine glycosidase II [Armatimonadaceae bacterium]